MSSQEYIDDCSDKSGPGKCVLLTGAQSTALQGLIANSVSSGKILTKLKRDIFNYDKIRIGNFSSVPEQVEPLQLDATSHVALRAILGMHGELAELTENLYPYIQNKNLLDISKLKEDLGDLNFYISLILKIIDTDWETIQRLNQNKTDEIIEKAP